MKKAFNMKVDGVAVINVRHKDGSVETFEKTRGSILSARLLQWETLA